MWIYEEKNKSREIRLFQNFLLEQNICSLLAYSLQAVSSFSVFLGVSWRVSVCVCGCLLKCVGMRVCVCVCVCVCVRVFRTVRVGNNISIVKTLSSTKTHKLWHLDEFLYWNLSSRLRWNPNYQELIVFFYGTILWG